MEITQKIIISREDYIRWASSGVGRYYLHFEDGVVSDDIAYNKLYPFECEARWLTAKEIKQDYLDAGYYSYDDLILEQDPIWNIFVLEDKVKITKYRKDILY